MVYGMNNNTNSYDYVAAKFLPVLKARTAVLLFNKYKLTQQSIAKMLGVSQAEISKYLNRQDFIPKSAIADIDDDDIEEFTKSMVINDEYNAQRIVCRICPKGVSNSCNIMIK